MPADPAADPSGDPGAAALRARIPADIAARVVSLGLGEGAGAGGIVRVVVDGGGLAAGARLALERAIDAALAGAPGVGEVRIAVMADRGDAPAAPPGPRIIAVGSGKGGVGKSTLAANLAVALARMGRNVGLVDADIYGPSQPTLLGAMARPQARNQRLIPVPTRWGVPVLSMGQLVEPGQAIAWRGPKVAGALSQLVEAEWGDAELLVIDLPPGTGDVQLTMVQKHKPAGAVIVSTPQDLALIDATRALSLFATAGVPVIGLVENMAGYACPHCGEVSDPFGHGGVETAAAALGHAFIGRVPLTLAIRTASDAGEPPAAGDGAAAAAFAAIAAAVAGWLDAAPGAPGAGGGAEAAARAG